MNLPGAPSAVTGQPTLPEPPEAVSAVLRWLCDPRPETACTPVEGLTPLSGVLEGAIEAKLICLLADRLLYRCFDVEISRAMHSFLAQLLRTNARHADIHRGEAVRIVEALSDQGVPAAVLNGLAYDPELYRPGGIRQFTDIDLLVEPADRDTALGMLMDLGFSEHGRRAHTRRRPTGDTMTRFISVDITTSLCHTADPADIRRALADAHHATSAAAGEELPVLIRADALRHALARLVARPRWVGLADAARLTLACQGTPAAAEAGMPEPARTGWRMLRTYLPDLPLSPPATPESGPAGRQESPR